MSRRGFLPFMVVLVMLINVVTVAALDTRRVYVPVAFNPIKPTPTPTPIPTPTPEPTEPPPPAMRARLGAQLETRVDTINSFVPGSVVKLSILWNDVEQTRGVYTWPEKFEYLYNQAQGHDLVIGLKTVPPWARQEDTTRMCKPPRERYYEDFGRFAVAVIDRYKPVVVEIGNEAELKQDNTAYDAFLGCYWEPDDYADFLDVVYPMIKAAHPEVRVWAGASGHVRDWTDSFAMYTDQFDAFSIHAYSYWQYGVYNEIVLANVAAANVWSNGKPVVISETGLICNDRKNKQLACGSLFEDDQVVFFEWFMATYSSQFEYIIWYTQADHDWVNTDLAHNGRLKPVWFVWRDYILGG